ncbi:MAG: hypothetical protein K1X57_01040 [Gemmataceae bacterium]|nr:hypothetical protein [Gemmataceae bacterium]
MAMPIQFTCDCGRKLLAKDELAGKRVKCPQCGNALAIPGGQGTPGPISKKPQPRQIAFLEIRRIETKAAMLRKANIVVDGETVGAVDNGDTQAFEVPVGHHTVKVTLGSHASDEYDVDLKAGESADFELEIKSRMIDLDLELRCINRPSRDAVRKSKASLKARKSKGGTLPVWSYAFICACGLIPVLTLGGAIPMGIGVGGICGCMGIARKPSMSTGSKVAACVGITIGCWVVFVGFLVAFVMLTNR